jgi:hypothetical protein
MIAMLPEKAAAERGIQSPATIGASPTEDTITPCMRAFTWAKINEHAEKR